MCICRRCNFNFITFFICSSYSCCCRVYILSFIFTSRSYTIFFIRCFNNFNLLFGICCSTTIFTSKCYSNLCFSGYITFIIFCICPCKVTFEIMSGCRDLIHFQIITGCFESIWFFAFCFCIRSSCFINILTCFFTSCCYAAVFVNPNIAFQFFFRCISTSRTFNLSSCFVWGFSIFTLSFCLF